MWERIVYKLDDWAIKKYKGSSPVGVEQYIYLALPTFIDDTWQQKKEIINKCRIMEIESDPISKTHEIYTINGHYGYKLDSMMTIDFPDKNITNYIIPRPMTDQKEIHILDVVRKVRNHTKAGYQACKEAIEQAINEGIKLEKEIIERAFSILASKKQITSSTTISDFKEGRIAVDTNFDKTAGVIIALGCKSEAATNTEIFIKLLDNIIIKAVNNLPETTIDLLSSNYCNEDHTIAEEISNVSEILKEELKLLYYSMMKVPTDTQVISCYEHYVSNGCKLGTLGMFEKSKESEDLFINILMQIAAYNPLCKSEDELLPEIILNEKNIIFEELTEDPKLKNKPIEVKEKITENKLKAFFEEALLYNQKLSTQPNFTVKEYMDKYKIILFDFERYKIG
jgi:elongation factor Ts